MTGADWVWGLAALCEAAGQSLYLLGSEPGRRPRGRARGCAAGTRGLDDRRHPPRLLRARLAAQRARDRGHQRAPAGHPARRDGDAEAGAVGRSATPTASTPTCCGRSARCSTTSPARAARAALAGRQRAGMDLPTRDRAAADVAPLPAGQPGLPVAGGGARRAAGAQGAAGLGRRRRTGRRGAGRCARSASSRSPTSPRPRARPGAGLGRRRHRRRAGRPAGGVAAVLLFGAGGFGLVRLLLPDPACARHELLWVLPVGACAVALRDDGARVRLRALQGRAGVHRAGGRSRDSAGAVGGRIRRARLPGSPDGGGRPPPARLTGAARGGGLAVLPRAAAGARSR